MELFLIEYFLFELFALKMYQIQRTTQTGAEMDI
jgi:hypothetical protein